MPTSLALMSAVLQITPAWFLSIPAVLPLAMKGRYVEAVFVTAVHQILLEYGTAAIQDEVPGQNAYLTGLSTLGGIALFPSMLERAIMGPLLMTMMIAFKNLYVEFVLASGKEATAH
ncbi:transmembrane protein 245-like [Pyrus x bretschneideri]|uniref:transmembrane protein 245-like n=1 Tax=Pyrus x bretschneideri TaxID=225117 RepID=UPI00202F55E7|nr:transmembrane protein 245-like [Pyrus x bretschneideri]